MWEAPQQAEMQNGKWKCNIQECAKECTNQAILTKHIHKAHGEIFPKDPKRPQNSRSANKIKKTYKNYWGIQKSYNQEELEYGHINKQTIGEIISYILQKQPRKGKGKSMTKKKYAKSKTLTQLTPQDRGEPEIHLMTKAQRKK